MFNFFCCTTDCANHGRDDQLIESISAHAVLRNDEHHDGSSDVVESDDDSDDSATHEWVATNANDNESDAHLNAKMPLSGFSLHLGQQDCRTKDRLEAHPARSPSSVQDMQVQLAEIAMNFTKRQGEVNALKIQVHQCPGSSEPLHQPRSAETLSVPLQATSSANSLISSSHMVASCEQILPITMGTADQCVQLSQLTPLSKTAGEPDAASATATQSTMDPLGMSRTLSRIGCISEDLSDMQRLLSKDRCSSENLVSSGGCILPSGWRQTTEPVHTCHTRSKGDDLEVKLADIVIILDGLEQEMNAVLMTSDRAVAMAKRTQLLASCNRVYGQLSELACDALERGYDRNVPGAMNVFQIANSEVDRVACLLQMVQQLLA